MAPRLMAGCSAAGEASFTAQPEQGVLTAPVLTVSARTDEGEIMAVRHRTLAVEGVQFHPESILTPDGPRLLENFLRFSDAGAA